MNGDHDTPDWDRWDILILIATIVLFFLMLCIPAFTQEMLKAEPVDLGLNVVLQISSELESTNTFTVTNNVNDMLVASNILNTAFVGPVIKLSWNTVSNVTYIIRRSTNDVEYHQLPVNFVGDGKTFVWYQNHNMGATDYFQLIKIYIPPTVPQSPPKNLRIAKP